MDTDIAAHTLEFLVYGVVTCLTVGQAYLWWWYSRMSADIAQMKQSDSQTSKTLDRMERVLTDTNKIAHDLDKRLAVIEDRAVDGRVKGV